VPEAIEEVRKGRFVIILDDENRENEGDLMMAAERVTPESINFMARYGRGLICMPMTAKRLRAIDLQLMTSQNTESMGTAFTVSVDARQNTTTGISAFDRATTVHTLINPETTRNDLVTPGHLFPLQAKEGGVLRRTGHTEACVDLAGLTGLYPAGVICEIMAEDGTMARLPELERFAQEHGLKMVTIESLISYRMQREKLIKKVSDVSMPTDYGDFRAVGYESILDGQCHVALVAGDPAAEDALVRVHSECLTGDVFGSKRCDCGEQIRKALHLIIENGNGVLLYMRQEGRGIGLANKLRAYALQDAGSDTVEANNKLGYPADLRDYGIGAQILVDLGIKRIRLLTNNPRKVIGLQGYGLKIVERVPLETEPNSINRRYLETKRDKLHHLLLQNEIS
jgi:3,4-dihydroxy 2-butanone 4-phosphate synthase/GTP cyclohydrolase II